jgi:quercetin dioxygenase-like cupin family protein
VTIPEGRGGGAAPIVVGEVQLACADLAPALAFFVGELGFRIDTIFPAERPTIASLSGHGLRLRLAPGDGDPGHLRLARGGAPIEGEAWTTAPNGTRIEWVAADPPIETPPLVPEFVIARASEGGAAEEGRAGMIYRDLIPGRLGGRFIASHITVPGGGPVADWVHFHKVRFQMIFCRRGWARLVYEDQGPPFIMGAGDCVLQPPRIRHRVLEASDGFEVVEIGCPALHETLADHDMVLPTSAIRPERDFGGQVFMRHVAAETAWSGPDEAGFEHRPTAMAAATRGLADVGVIRPGDRRRARGAGRLVSPAHGAELLFGFLLEGSARLHCRGSHDLGPADAFVIPPSEAWALSDGSPDLALLRVRVG